MSQIFFFIILCILLICFCQRKRRVETRDRPVLGGKNRIKKQNEEKDENEDEDEEEDEEEEEQEEQDEVDIVVQKMFKKLDFKEFHPKPLQLRKWESNL